MAFLTVGPNSSYPTIAAAMLVAGINDTIVLEPGYSNETATVTHAGITVSGVAPSTGIILQLGLGIPTLTLAGTAQIDVLDAADGNGIVGNDGANTITVSGGADAVNGGLGVDRLVVDYHLATGAITGDSTSNVAEAGGRLVTITNGTFEHFTILTGSAADTITTGAGDDIIITGEGVSTVTAGEGANRIIGGSGADTVTASNGGNFIDGGNGVNVITSGAGNDTITGGIGADTIVAGGGDDLITVRGGIDTSDSGAGVDRLVIDYAALTTSVTGGVTAGTLLSGYSGLVGAGLANTVAFLTTENFTITTGSGNDVITTGDGSDVLSGGAGVDRLDSGGGDDFLDGGFGADVLLGGTGDDVYVVDNAADIVTEATSGGTDTVYARANYALGAAQQVEYLRADAGSTGLTLAGNELANAIVGGAGNDTIEGRGGNDTIDGGASTDIVTFIGARADYDATFSAGLVHIVHARNAMSDGTDTVANAEIFRFADADYTLADLINEAPVAQAISNSGDEDTLVTGSVVATDADGDSLIYAVVSDAKDGNANPVAGLTFNADGTYSFQGPQNFNGTVSFTYKANDGALDSNIATVTLTVGAVNDAPMNTVPVAQTVAEDTNLSITGLSVSDVDAGAAGITVTLSVASGMVTVLASVSGGLAAAGIANNGTGTVTLTGSVAAINTTLAASNGVVYRGTADVNGSDTLTMVSNDGGHTGTPGAQTDTDGLAITMTAVNDAPVLNSAIVPSLTPESEDATAPLNGSAVGTLVSALIDLNPSVGGNDNVTDVDASPLTGIAVVGVAGLADVYFSLDNGGTWTLATGLSEDHALLLAADANTRIYVKALANLNGSDWGATFRAWDQSTGSAGTYADTTAGHNGGTTAFSTDIANTVLFLTPVNDAPAGADATLTTSEDTAHSFSAADFGFTDAVDGASASGANALQAVIITTLPTAGTLTLGGYPVAVGDTISLANISSLVFTPAANANGNGHASLTFQVVDDGGIANGGVNTDQSANTITFNVTAVNDAPAGADATLTTSEDTARSFSAADFGFTDAVDGASASGANALQAVIITTLPTAGMLTLIGNPVVAGDTISLTDIPNLVFTPAADANGQASFTFQVVDNGGIANGGANTDQSDNTITFNVTAANDQPTLTGLGGTVTTDEQTAVVLDNNALIADIDLDVLNGGNGLYTGASLTLARTGGASAQDTYGFNTAGALFTVSGGNLQVGGQTFATFTAIGGMLTISFTSTGTAATSALVDDVLRHVTYTNASDAPPASVVLDYIFNDGNTAAGQGSGGPLSATGSTTVNITAVNDAPTAAAPPIYSGQPNVTIDLKGTGLSVADIDAGAGSVTVTLSVTHGTLTVVAGASGAVVGGTPSAVTITGTIAQINALLNNVDPTSTVSFVDPAPAGPITLTLGIDDGGNTGTPGQLTGSDSATIILDVPPVVGNTGQTVDYSEQQTSPSAVVIDSDLMINDADAPGAGDQINSATVAISTGFVAGDQLNFTNQGTISGSYDSGAGILMLTGPATMAEYQAALRSITFSSTSDNPTNFGGGTPRIVSWTVKDIDDLESSPATSTINVTAVNDAPSATITPLSYSATEQVSLNLKDTGLSVADVDGGATPQTETVTLSVGQGVLNATIGNSSITIDSGNGTSSLQISGTIAQINAFLGAGGTSTLDYFNSSDDPSASTTLTLAINDGGNAGTPLTPLTASDMATINIAAVNDPPVLTGTLSATIDEGGDHIILTSELGFNDPDDAAASVTFLVSGAVNGEVRIGGVAVTSFTFQQLTDGDVSFRHGGGETAAASFQVTVEDDDEDGSVPVPQIFNLNVNAVNDAPSLSVAQAASFTENGAPVTLDPALTIADPDSGVGYSATVQIGTGFVAGDVLAGAGGTYDAGTHTFTTNVAPTFAALQAILQTLSFSSGSANPTSAPRTLTWTINDGSGVNAGSVTATTVNVTSINDAPSGATATITAFEDTARTLTAADFDFSDVDGNTFATATITTLPGAGTLTNNGIAVGAGASVTIAEINAGQFVFRAAAEASGAAYATFTFQVQDNGGTAGGGINLDPTPNTLTINVDAVNDPATVALSNVHGPVAENASTAIHIKVADIAVSDPDGGSVNNLSLSGLDASLFEIVGTELFLKAGAHLDFETNPVLNVAVNVNDTSPGGRVGVSASLAINIIDIAEGLTGTPGNDTLVSTNNGETINGLAGNDRIIALGGNDRIIGGLGADTLSGGAGADMFVFSSVHDSAPGQSGLINNGSYSPISGQGLRDIITDFTHGQDRFDFSVIDANIRVAGNQAFTWRGTGNFTGAPGQLIERLYNPAGTANDKTIIYGDISGDARADFQIELTGLKVLTASDFIL